MAAAPLYRQVCKLAFLLLACNPKKTVMFSKKTNPCTVFVK